MKTILMLLLSMAGILQSRSHPPLSKKNPFEDPNCSEIEGRMICCQETSEECSGYTGKFTKREGECEIAFEFQNGSSKVQKLCEPQPPKRLVVSESNNFNPNWFG